GRGIRWRFSLSSTARTWIVTFARRGHGEHGNRCQDAFREARRREAAAGRGRARAARAPGRGDDRGRAAHTHERDSGTAGGDSRGPRGGGGVPPRAAVV